MRTHSLIFKNGDRSITSFEARESGTLGLTLIFRLEKRRQSSVN